MDKVEFYEAKLAYETDSWDLSESLKNGEEVVVIDARSKEAYQSEHIPSAINLPHRTISPASTKENMQRPVQRLGAVVDSCNVMPSFRVLFTN